MPLLFSLLLVSLAGCYLPEKIPLNTPAPLLVITETPRQTIQPPAHSASETPNPIAPVVLSTPALPPVRLASFTATQATSTLALTNQPSSTNSPTPTLAQTITNTAVSGSTLRPTRTPTITATPRIAMAGVRITRPGQLSRLVSPIQMYFSLIPVDNGFVRIELLGEDGRLLYRNLIRYGWTTGYRLPMTETLDFTIPGAGEMGRLQVIVEDSDQRVVSLSSVDVILLAMGENERNPGGDNLDPFSIQKPWTQALVQGGTLQVNGYLRPLNTVQPVIFEVFTNRGELAGSKQLAPQAITNGRHYPFELEIPYQVARDTWARLVIRQTGERIPGDAALTSFQIFLKP